MPVDKSMPILVVDDYKSMVRIIRGMLTELGFSNIDDAADGAAALELIRKNDYGLVLSDWNMQPMTGIDLARAVRSEERTAKLPFIMITAEAKVENVLAARHAGVNNYVIKPFTLAVLKQKISSVIGDIG